MTYKAAIFDLDGTLLDTLADLADSGNRTLAALGLPEHEQTAYRWFVGDGLATLISRILPANRRDAGSIAEGIALFTAEYSRNWNVRTEPYAGIRRMLDELAALNVPMAILSNKPDAFTQVCIREYFPEGLFCQIFGQRDHVPKKPDPAGALELAEMMGIAPASILYVGDTATDMQTAVNAGMDGAGVLWGFRPEEDLRSGGARYLIRHPCQLVSMFAQGPRLNSFS